MKKLILIILLLTIVSICNLQLLYSQSGQIHFTNVGKETHTRVGCNAHGSGFFDYNGDGLPDIFVVHNESVGDWADKKIPHTLLKNLGDGTFKNVTSNARIKGYNTSAQGFAAADYDNDGNRDLAIAMGYNLHGRILLYYNGGEGSFQDATDYARVGYKNRGRNLVFVDYQNDGLLDLFSFGDSEFNTPSLLVFRNKGYGQFTLKSEEAGLDHTRNPQDLWGCAFADIDNDGDMDFFSANYETECHLFVNNGNGTFSEETTERGIIKQNKFYGAIFFDYNNDGWFDLYARRYNSKSILYENNKDGTFSNVTSGTGLGEILYRAPYGGGLSVADFNNDGFIDILAITSVGKYFRLYQNNGDGTFTNVAKSANILKNIPFNYSAPIADYNQDGYLDFYLARCDKYPPDYYATLYENSGGTNHWSHVKLIGIESNREAIGARVVAYTNGKLQVRQVLGGDGYKMDSLPVEFGLAENCVVDSLVIYWPSGIIQKEILFPSDTLITLEEREGVHYYSNLISGDIDYYEQNKKVPSVQLKVTGTSSTTAFSNQEGFYQFVVGYGSNILDITPSKTADLDVGECTISAYDAGLTAQSAEGIKALTGISAKAADVNDNKLIDAMDALMIAQRAVGLSNSTESFAGDWRFDPLKIHIDGIIESNIEDQDFTAWILGDVNGDWAQTIGLEKNLVSMDSESPQYTQSDSTVSIALTLPGNVLMLSSDLWLEYDPSLFAVHDVKKTSLTHGFELVYNDGTPGILKIALFNSVPIWGEDEFLQIIFDIIPEVIEDTTHLQWRHYRINDTEYDKEDIIFDLRTFSLSGNVKYYQNNIFVPGVTLSLSGAKEEQINTNSEGIYQFVGIKVGESAFVTPSKAEGEDMGELVISAYDAFLAARHSVNIEHLSGLKIEAADVDKNGKVEMSDAEGIATASVGFTNSESHAGAWGFSPPSYSYSNITEDVEKNFLAYIVGDINGDWLAGQSTQSIHIMKVKSNKITKSLLTTAADEFSITLTVDEGDSLGSADIWFEYDESAIEFINIVKTDKFNDFYLTYKSSTPGIVKVAMFNTGFVKGSSDFIKLNFRVISHEITTINWKHYRINGREYNKNDIEIDNRIKVYVTINTDPQGLDFYANAALYTAPHTFSWTEGTLYYLKAESPQSSGQHTRYVFSSWSDGGDLAHTYEVPGTNDNLTITFKKQYYLSMDTPRGNPQGQAWYDENTNASFSVTTPDVQGATRYLFNSWGGDYTGTTSSGSVTMDNPKIITASWDTQYYLDINSSYGNPQGEGWYDKSSAVFFSVSSPVKNDLTKYIFEYWSGDYSGTATSGSVVMDDAKLITAHWSIEHYLSLSEQPDEGGDITPSPPGGWYTEDSSVELNASAAENYQFTGWSGDLSDENSSAVITISEPKSITANFSKEIQITINTDPPGLDFYADDNSYTAPHTFTWLENTGHDLDLDSLQSVDNTTRYTFNTWNNQASKNQLYTVPSIHNTLCAHFFIQYYLEVNSSYGNPQGEGWFNQDSTAVFSVNRYHYNDKTRFKFFNWSGDAQGDTSVINSLIMDSPKTVTANWQTQYYLTVENNGYGTTQGQGWYDEGIEASFSIAPTIISMKGDSQYVFTGWTGSGIGSYSGENVSNTLIINNPVTETASWELQYKITTSTIPAWGGSIELDTGTEWCKKGDQVTVTAVPASDTDYEFTLWSGDLSGNTNPDNVVVNSPKEICAHFIIRGVITVTTEPEGIPITVDDTTYISPHQFRWISGTIHTISTPKSHSPLEGVDYIFDYWNNEGKRAQEIEAGVSQIYKAFFLTKYYLLTSVNPPEGGDITPLSDWFDKDSTITVKVEPSEGFAFLYWSGDLSGNTNPDDIIMSSPKKLTAEMKRTTAIHDRNTGEFPTCFTLRQNQPNPFNPETIIEFDIPKSCSVELSVYNSQGQHIQTLAKGERTRGRYTVIWNGTNVLGKPVSSGIYFYILKAGSELKIKKCILLR